MFLVVECAKAWHVGTGEGDEFDSGERRMEQDVLLPRPWRRRRAHQMSEGYRVSAAVGNDDDSFDVARDVPQ